MKKCLVFSTLALLVSAVSVVGQVMGVGDGKIDVGAIKKAIETSDADIKDPKKSDKWLTWIDRGDIYMEAANAPTKGLYRGLPMDQMSKLYQPKPVVKSPVKLRGEKGTTTEYVVHEYDRFRVYFADKKLSMWEENTVVLDSLALDKAADAYDHAFALDAKATERAYKGLNEIVKMIKDRAVTFQRLEKNGKSAEEYRRSYIIQTYPLISVVDTTDLFFAAMNFSVAQRFEEALECLKELQRLGYYGKDANGKDNGDVYYYMYHSYNGLDKQDSARMILLEGARKFPNVSKLYRSLPIMYAVNVDQDIKDIEPIMEKAFADPENKEKPKQYYGMAQAYSQRRMNDKALEYFIKAADADKTEFSYQFNTALLYLKKGEQKNGEAQEQAENLSEAEYKKVQEEVLAIYEKAVPYLEAAYSIEPENESVVEILAGITFKLREKSDKMMEKSKKYGELDKALKAKAEAAPAANNAKPDSAKAASAAKPEAAPKAAPAAKAAPGTKAAPATKAAK